MLYNNGSGQQVFVVLLAQHDEKYLKLVNTIMFNYYKLDNVN